MAIVRLGRLKGRAGLRGRRAWLNGVLDQRLVSLRGPHATLADLGQTTYLDQPSQTELAADWNAPDTPLTLDPTTGIPFATGSTAGAGYGTSSVSSPYGTSAVPGSISPQDALLLSSAITAAGKVGTQAIIGTPTVTYNPITGTYSATGGAAIPTGAIEASSIGAAFTEYLPYLLIGGALILVISMAGKR